MRRPSVPVAVGIVTVGLLATACRPDTVRIAFRPRVGAHYRYEIVVRTVTTVRLGGGGRLVELGVRGGRAVASIRSQTTLLVATISQLRGGRLALTGVEATDSTATRDVLDGAVERAGSTTRGTFQVTLASPSEG